MAEMFPIVVGKIHVDFRSVDKCSLQAKRVLHLEISTPWAVFSSRDAWELASSKWVYTYRQDTSCHITSTPCYVILTV